MKEEIIQAMLAKYEGDYLTNKATLEIYLNNPVAIGEHPQHIEEIDKLVSNMVESRDKSNMIKSVYK